MSQNSIVLPTTGTVSGLQMMQNINNALDTLNTLASGASAPAVPEAGQWWHDTASNMLKIRSMDNAAWIALGSLDEANGIWVPPVGGGIIPSLASAATTDIGSVREAAVIVTGTTAIASFGAAALQGIIKFITFTDTLTLTRNATSLILPAASNITTVAGDTLVVLSLGNGNWRVLQYQRADGSPLQGNNPPGTIIQWAGTSAPSGYLQLPTAATNISRSVYGQLFAAIGTTWGAGDGSTTFGIPFCPAGYTMVYGASGSANTIGQVIAHTHPNSTSTTQNLIGGGNGAFVNLNTQPLGPTGSTGGAANLAAGMNIMYCIKY